ncbi:MAG TPA: ABC transporter permease [Candidatus Acidoferrales bacterium]|nr:ABC transporter permease [Candidatus Acidoferrales bacterium]
MRSLFQRNSADAELSTELHFHVERQITANIASGMPPAEARRAALREFGGVEQVKEECRDMRKVNWLQDLAPDLRYGIRTLRKSPGFTAVAVLTLALGIGANSAIFSLVNGIVLRPLPYSQPQRLVSITDSYPQGALVAMRASLKTLDVAGSVESTELNLTGRGNPTRLYAASVSPELFSILGATPELGRTFQSGEDQPGRDSFVILSQALWQSEFGGDPTIIGRSVTLEGVDRRIVGVMPPDFRFPSSKTQLWIPLHLDPRNVGAYWGGGFMPVVGRLRDGVTLEQARAEVRAVLPRIRGMFPWKMPDLLWAGSGVIPLQQSIVGDTRATLLILLGAIGLVLLIACANVANLLLSRAATRQREMAVRAALGAGRWRICRQLLAESVILAIGGGALGLWLATNGVSWLKLLLPADTPRLASVSIDWRVLAFTAAVALLTGLIFGFAPAFHSSRIDLSSSLKTSAQNSGAAGGNRLRSVLAIAEIAVAVVLVIGAGLLVRSLWQLSHVNPGFSPESIVTARITPNESLCKPISRCESFYQELITGVGALPGTSGAALVNALPLNGRFSGYAADVEGHPRNPKDPAFVLWESIITPDYLSAMGIPVLRGRGFTPADSAPGAPPVTLVTAATARKFWPNQDPLGKHVKRAWTNEWITVVGVVADVNEDSLASALPAYVDGAVYDPYGNNIGSGGGSFPTEMTLVMHTSSPSNYADLLQRTVAALNPEVPVSEVATLRTIVSQSLTAPRSTMSLFAIFAVLALALGAVGIYGVVSYSVAQRTSEIGVRMALGAQRRDVMQLVMRYGVLLALVGVAVGLAGAFAATRAMASLLYGVTATDPLTFLAIALLLTAVTLAACYIPARRAMKVDPIIALRHE